MTQTLPAIEGTDYTVEVIREDGNYTVSVTREPNQNETKMFHAVYGYDKPTESEVIGKRTLPGHATSRHLNRLVEDIITTDSPSLVGIYTSTEKETE